MSVIEIIAIVYVSIDILACIALLIMLRRNGVLRSISSLLKSRKAVESYNYDDDYDDVRENDVYDDDDENDSNAKNEWDDRADELADTIN